MTAFGHDTFKQDLFEEIEYLMQKHKRSPLEAIAETLDVARYMAEKQTAHLRTYRQEVISEFLAQYSPPTFQQWQSNLAKDNEDTSTS